MQKEDSGEMFDLVNKNFLFVLTGLAGYLFGPAIRKKG